MQARLRRTDVSYRARMKLFALVIALAACGGAAPVSPSTLQSDSDPRIARVESGLGPTRQVVGEEVRHALRDRMRELKIPAVSIAVFEKHQLVWAKAYGYADVDREQLATNESMFQAASISKPVNALAVMLAVADGTLLSLDAPINDQLASWKLPDNEHTKDKPVTLRHLLSHTGGTTVHGFPGYAAKAPLPTTQQILDGVSPANSPAVRVDMRPGTFRYSGGGTTITQLALVDRSEKPYPEILATRVLGPLGMVHSTFEQPLSEKHERLAVSAYHPDLSKVEGRYHVYPEMAAAALWTTPSDLARFFAELSLARAGRSKIIGQKIAVEMTTRVGDGPTGLGPFLEERAGAKLFGHNGGNEGFRCLAIASLDDGYGVVVMTNSDNGGQILGEIESAVFHAFGWPGARKPIVRFAMSPEKRARFVGHYDAGGFIPVIIDEVGGKLMFGQPFGQRIELVPIAEDAVAGTQDDTLRVSPSGALEVANSDGKVVARVSRAAGPPHPFVELAAGRFDAAVAAWKASATKAPLTTRAEEATANQVGYNLLADRPAEAILVFRLVATVFPESSNAHDSLGEAYMRTGDKQNAIAEYEKALATLDADPRIPADKKANARASAEKQLATLRAK
jgi:CubicO group peptidase (beta-lactamase class C family)